MHQSQITKHLNHEIGYQIKTVSLHFHPLTPEILFHKIWWQELRFRLLCVGRHSDHTSGRSDDRHSVAGSTTGTVRREPTQPTTSNDCSNLVPMDRNRCTAHHHCASHLPMPRQRRGSGRRRLWRSRGTTLGRSAGVLGRAHRCTTRAGC